MHDHGADLASPERHRLPEGATVSGTVVCHHLFGLGMYIESRDEYAHVDIPFIGPDVQDENDFPRVGERVEGTVFGYSGLHSQLRVGLWVPSRDRGT